MPRPRVTQSEAVLDAAARRLTAHGIAGTTVDDVATEAGVSRATVYRYLGGKNEIVQGVIGRETATVLVRVADVIARSTTPRAAIAEAVSTALAAIAANPVLSRMTTDDLAQTLPFITLHAASISEIAVATLAPAMRDAPGLVVEESAIEAALEEATRFVLTHLTTPRSDGSRLDATEAGERAAALIAPLLAPAP